MARKGYSYIRKEFLKQTWNSVLISYRFVPYICYASKNIHFMLNTLNLSEISSSKQKIKL